MFEIKVPRFDVNDNNVTIIEIYVSDGMFIKKNDVIAKAESTKMVKDIVAEEEGYIKLLSKRFDVKSNGETIGILFATKDEYERSFESNVSNENENNNCNEVNATTKAKLLAKKLNIDINEIALDKKGMIIKTSDVEEYHKKSTDAKPKIRSNNNVPIAINNFDRERVMIIGAGRLAEQIIDIMMDDKGKYIAGLVDSYKKTFESYNYPLFNCNVKDFPDEIDRSYYDTVIIAFGGDKKAMMFRRELYDLYKKKGISFTNAIGDNTNIRRAVKIGENNIIMHNCFIGTGAQIGNDNIISYGSCIGHHCVIGDHNLFAPGFMTPGSVKVGDRNIIMTSVNTINYITIGNDTVLPVGYNVTKDIADGTNLLN